MSDSSQRTKVAIVYGGRSSEHNISCVSAGAIMSHLDSSRFEVIPVGITQSGRWVQGESDPERLRTNDRVLPEVDPASPEITLSLNPERRGEFSYVSDGSRYAQVDVIFPVLHGPFGEDGTIQGLFELSGLPYVGPGVLASACGMDKEFTKKIMREAGIPTCRDIVVDPRTPLRAEDKETLGLPVFVKPARGGSSIGVSKVDSWDNIDEAIAKASRYDAKVLVEAELVGDEVEVGVLQYPDGELKVSVPAKLNNTEDSAEGFYGFETKYLDDVVSPTIPAPYPQETLEELQRLALKAYQAISAKGLARIDFFLTPQGPILNEVNTLPGFTPISMYPQVFQASGVTYQELLSVLIDEALARSRN
ncbi:D-alanine--D-alanine ligase [Corynebacterium poyangense]|uniref:D-alanine--D-alanine ligase n=1 Tax=Corynebacterium poyangense TaxID=2684405 RepID=A0A7H0SNK4_9CORY|nr:D-alanine--D-alanine ligase family protein [Corynebacterium poyangense]QNQ90129.1 D-alanine--D-alanine ligase [Corynebacterium poyangense]